MLLIITRSLDPVTDVVISSLRERGVTYARLNTDHPIDRTTRTVRICNETQTSIRIDDGRSSLFLDDVTTVWNRRHERPAFRSTVTSEDQIFIQHEHKHFTLGLWLMLQNRLWINSYEATIAAEAKPYQLEIARTIGLRIPRTLMTNDPLAAISFFDECEGEVVYKTFRQTHRKDSEGTVYGIYTSPITRNTLSRNSAAIRLTPCLFQENIAKALDLRITIIGEQCFAIAIDTTRSARPSLDWRRSNANGTAYHSYNLPQQLKTLLQRLMSRLGLVFGCIDMAVTPAGEFVFFEINSMGDGFGSINTPQIRCSRRSWRCSYRSIDVSSGSLILLHS